MLAAHPPSPASDATPGCGPLRRGRHPTLRRAVRPSRRPRIPSSALRRERPAPVRQSEARWPSAHDRVAVPARVREKPMRRNALFATAATLGAFLLTYTTPAGQDLGRGSTFVAFRVDGTHVIATLKVIETSAAGAAGPTVEPAAQYGFPYFDAPA